MSRGIQEFFYIVRYFSVFYGSERNDREANCLIEKRSGRMEYAREVGKTDVQDDPKVRELLRRAFGALGFENHKWLWIPD